MPLYEDSTPIPQTTGPATGFADRPDILAAASGWPQDTPGRPWVGPPPSDFKGAGGRSGSGRQAPGFYLYPSALLPLLQP